jgi:hypothetical protein
VSSAKGRRAGIPERDVEAYGQEQIILHGGLCYLVAPRGTKGPPDTVVVWPRDGWAKVDLLEFKTIGGGLEEPQILLHAALAEMNCMVKVIWTKAQVDRYVEENGTRQVTGCSTLAGLMERARHSKWYERIKALHVPRRKKKVAIQLAPPGVEFAPYIAGEPCIPGFGGVKRRCTCGSYHCAGDC